MQAFASEPVTTAMQASSTAHMKALAAHKSWDAMARRVLPAADSEGTAAPAVEAAQALDGQRMPSMQLEWRQRRPTMPS